MHREEESSITYTSTVAPPLGEGQLKTKSGDKPKPRLQAKHQDNLQKFLDTSFSFDTPGRVNGMSYKNTVADTAFDERSYTWDAVGNKTQRLETVGGVAVKTYDYVYDALNRMEQSTKTLADGPSGSAVAWLGAITLNSLTPRRTQGQTRMALT